MRFSGGGDRSHLMLTLERDTTAPRSMRPSKILMAQHILWFGLACLLCPTRSFPTRYMPRHLLPTYLRQLTMFAGCGRRTYLTKQHC